MEFKGTTGEEIRRGEIFWYRYEKDDEGSEQSGTRPCVVVSNNKGNTFGQTVTIVPFTTADKKKLPTHVDIDSCLSASIAVCEQIKTVSKTRIGRYIGEVTEKEMKEIERALLVQLDLVKANKAEIALPTVKEEPKVLNVAANVDMQVQLAEAKARADVYEKLYKDLLSSVKGVNL